MGSMGRMGDGTGRDPSIHSSIHPPNPPGPSPKKGSQIQMYYYEVRMSGTYQGSMDIHPYLCMNEST